MYFKHPIISSEEGVTLNWVVKGGGVKADIRRGARF